MADQDGPVRPSTMDPPERDAPSQSGLMVVGIGASAGGLQALRRFFGAVPRDSGVAYVAVVHLSPHHESHLADLLQPYSAIPLVQVSDTSRLEANHAYIIPPGCNLATADSHLRLTPLESARKDRAPIDHFFRTLAATHDGAAVGVILSGTGTDGADGVRHIRENGGLVIVQDPSEAEYDGMPRSAIATGLVDLVSPVAEMPKHILAFLATRPKLPVTDDGEAADDERPDLLQRVLSVLRLRTGHDFLRYKRSTVARRVARRMQVLGIHELSEYLALLRENGREAAALLDDLLINVTSFFRDGGVFETLERDVIPRIFEGRGPTDRIRVWSVGCSTGKEAYSLGMLLLEEAAQRLGPPHIQVFASDLHERSLKVAREGLYPAVIAEDVSAERLDRFFRREGDNYRITKELRDVVVFAVHNLLQDPPFSRLDLIVCRNVLIYLQSGVQRQVIDLFHYALQGTGYLLLGTAETLERAELFRLENKTSHLYRRREAARSELRLPSPGAAMHLTVTNHLPAAPPTRGAQSFGALHQTMVERYAAPSLLVDPDHNVVHFSEHVGRFLNHPGGTPTTNVFKLVREELRMELRAALHAVRELHQPRRTRPIAVAIDGEPHDVVLRVSPAGDAETDGLVLVIFDELEATEPQAPAVPGQGDPNVRELEAELDLTRHRLQTMLEEFETSQEEMRASNEELQSANEELRSTMEELETSREELQSINEELQTLNQENKHKVEELSQLTNDLQNLLQATDVATLFLDRNLRILRYTPKVSDIFNVRHTDRGRPLGDLTHRLRYDRLSDDVRQVLQTLVPVEQEAAARDGERSFVVRITPYRTIDDRIEGVVITLVDVTALKGSELAVREREAQFRAVANLVPDLLWRTGPDGGVIWYNERWLTYTGQSRDHATGFKWLDLVHPDDRDAAQGAWQRALKDEAQLSHEYRIRGADGEYRWFLTRAEPLRDDAGKLVGWFAAASDVHEQRLAMEQVEQRVAQRTAELQRTKEALEAAAAERTAFRRQLTAAEEDERRRLGRELHDQLGQHLTAFALGLAETRRLLGEGGPAEARLVQLEEQARRMTRDARHLALELRPPELDDVGLESAIETYVSEWANRYGIAADVAVTGTGGGDIPSDVGTAVYRIVQEALTNVAKHAKATRASVILEWASESVRLIVEDNGRGFEVEAALGRARTERRLGLAGMQERASIAGGVLHVESAPGGGTAIYVRLPIPRPSG